MNDIKAVATRLDVISESILVRGYNGLSEDIKVAVEALKKQVPKKIVYQEYKYMGKIIRPYGIDGAPYDLCPSCNKNLCTEGKFGRPKMNYCPDCGQRLDWSVEE